MVYNGVLQNLLKDKKVIDISGHDTYIALVAFWLGTVVYDEDAYINYRQTGENLSLTGVSKRDQIKKKFVYLKKRMTVRKNIHEKNAKELLKHYGEKYGEELAELEIVADYRRNFLTRIRILFDKKYKTFSTSICLFNDFMILTGKL